MYHKGDFDISKSLFYKSKILTFFMLSAIIKVSVGKQNRKLEDRYTHGK